MDNSLFIDPSLLKAARTPEFVDSRARLNSYFELVIRLLKASKAPGDAAWREARNRLTFAEERGAALGYAAAGGRGSAIGPELASRLCNRAAEIIALGVDDPVIFELIPLFEDDFGADRLSDMAVAILRERFLSYTQRLAGELGVRQLQEFGIRDSRWRLPLYPDGKTPVILVPTELLNDLPVALDWSEIDEVARVNDEVRREWSKVFKSALKAKRMPTKSEIRHMLLNRDKNIRDLIEVYKNSRAVGYDFVKDAKGLFDWDEIAEGVAKEYPLRLEPRNPKSVEELKVLLATIIRQFQHSIEDNKLYDVLYVDGKPRSERFSQRLFYAIADSYCKANNVDISAEPNAGNGPVDFKLSVGYRGRVLVEVKLSSNPRLIHGFETQLAAYQEAEATEHACYLILRVADSDLSIKSVQQMRAKEQKSGRKVPELYIVDARAKRPASKR